MLRLLETFPDIGVVYPVHLSPRVRQTVFPMLGDHPRVELVDPMDYEPFLLAMDRAHLILTDSGGVQEEAPSLGKPVLVLRETTERPEAADDPAIVERCTTHVRSAMQAAVSDLASKRRFPVLG